MGFCIKVLENLLCSFNQLDHVSIKSQNNLQRFCRLLCLTSELINTRTYYIVGSFLGHLPVDRWLVKSIQLLEYQMVRALSQCRFDIYYVILT